MTVLGTHVDAPVAPLAPSALPLVVRAPTSAVHTLLIRADADPAQAVWKNGAIVPGAVAQPEQNCESTALGKGWKAARQASVLVGRAVGNEVRPGIVVRSVKVMLGVEKPGTEKVVVEKVRVEKLGVEKPGTENPGVEKPGIDVAVGKEKLGVEKPGTEMPLVEKPVGREKTAEVPEAVLQAQAEAMRAEAEALPPQTLWK